MAADYGIDAPKVIRNLFIVAAVALAVSLVRLSGLWSVSLDGSLGGDIRHGAEYAAAFSERGCTARHMESRWGSLLATVVTFGSLQPVKLMARKGPRS